MHKPDNTKKALGWPAALVILVALLLTEMLPIVFGQGVNAKFDYGFIYVTMHFILIPIACLAHVIWNTVGTTIHSKRNQLPWPITNVLSTVITAGCLVATYLHPMSFLRR